MPEKKKKVVKQDKMKEMNSYLNKVNGMLEDIILRMENMESEHDDLAMMTAGIKNDMDKVKPRLGLPVG